MWLVLLLLPACCRGSLITQFVRYIVLFVSLFFSSCSSNETTTLKLLTHDSFDAKQEIIGIRPGEKLHEQMISLEDAYSTYEYPEYYKILPQIYEWDIDVNRIRDGVKVPEGFVYTSDNNSEWMKKSELEDWINKNRNNIGNI